MLATLPALPALLGIVARDIDGVLHVLVRDLVVRVNLDLHHVLLGLVRVLHVLHRVHVGPIKHFLLLHNVSTFGNG